MPIPVETMRAVRYLGPNRPFELRAESIPDPAPGQVRVQIKACGICRTELHLREGLLDLGRRDFTVGHEIAGIVDAVGEGVSAGRVGERVVVYYYEGCGECPECNRGDEQLCANPKSQPGFISDGGYADYIVVRAKNCVAIPAHLTLADVAPLGCAGSTAVHAGRMANICTGEWVVVHGAGGVGQALLQYARASGGRVIAIDVGAEKKALSLRLGAEIALDASTEPDIAARVLAITGSGADVVFELVGTTDTMRQSVTMLRRRGRIVLIGYTTETLQIHPVELIVREAMLLGSVGSTLQDLHEVVDLVARGIVTFLVDRVLPLDRFEEGLEALDRQTTLGRIVLTM